MKRFFSLPALFLAMAITVHADDRTKNVQAQLKEQGFYYGEVDGKSSTELSAAVRRYQIRNGLEVTGDLSKETLDALGLGGAPAPAPESRREPVEVAKKPSQPLQPQSQTPPAPMPPPAVAQGKPHPPVNLRRYDDDVRESDRRALQDEPAAQTAPAVRPHGGFIPPPAPLDGGNAVAPISGGGAYGDFFAGTPYSIAPKVVQESTMRRAQQILAERGFYRDALDGAPGPAMEEAVLSYQRSARLPLTGRLDLQTLAALRLLPGRGPGNPPLRPFNSQGGDAPRQVYRGVWVN